MIENQKLNNRWIDTHDQSERLNQIMNCFSHRGIATGEQVEIMTSLGQHPVRDALKILTEPPGGLAPELRTINVTMPGQWGRPYAAFVLTEDGAAMLDENPRKAPKLDDPVEVAHALMEMQVFIAAYQQGKKPSWRKFPLLTDYAISVRMSYMRKRPSLRWSNKPDSMMFPGFQINWNACVCSLILRPVTRLITKCGSYLR